jgi:hypothetical protein
MVGGSTQQQNYPKYGLTIAAALPMVSTVGWFTVVLLNHQRTKANARRITAPGGLA